MKECALAVLLLCGSAGAEEPSAHRGWLTGAGLTLAGAGFVVCSVGAWHAAEGDAAGKALAGYYANGAAPHATEAGAVRWLQERSYSFRSQALALLLTGAIGLGLGAALVIIDGWAPSVAVAVQPSGASVVLSGRF